MQNFVPALLRLTARPRYWRIAVILPGRILWRTYSRVEYPTPDEAVLRCLAGLLFPDVLMAALKPGVHTPPSSDEEKSGDDKHHDANKTQGAITHEHPRSDFKKLIHKLLLAPEAACSFDDAAAESQSKFSRSEGQVHDSALHYDPSNRYHPAIVDTQIMTPSMTYSFPAAYSHRQTSALKKATTDTPNHSAGSQP